MSPLLPPVRPLPPLDDGTQKRRSIEHPRSQQLRRGSRNRRRSSSLRHAEQARYDRINQRIEGLQQQQERKIALMAAKRERMTERVEAYEQEYEEYTEMRRFYRRSNTTANAHYKRQLVSKVFIAWYAFAADKLRAEQQREIEFLTLQRTVNFNEAVRSDHLVHRVCFQAWRYYVKHKTDLEEPTPDSPKRGFMVFCSSTASLSDEQDDDDDDDEDSDEDDRESLDIFSLVDASRVRMAKRAQRLARREEAAARRLQQREGPAVDTPRTPSAASEVSFSKANARRLPTLAAATRTTTKDTQRARVFARNSRPRRPEPSVSRRKLRKKPSCTFGLAARSPSFLLPRIL